MKLHDAMLFEESICTSQFDSIQVPVIETSEFTVIGEDVRTNDVIFLEHLTSVKEKTTMTIIWVFIRELLRFA